MPLFGAHMSIAGGCHNAILSAQAHDFETVQLFTKNNNQWAAKELTDDDVKLFKTLLRRSKLKFATAHDSYLINLASPDAVLYRRSVEAFVVEMERAEAKQIHGWRPSERNREQRHNAGQQDPQ